MRFRDKVNSEVYIDICSRRKKQTTFAGQKDSGGIRVNGHFSICFCNCINMYQSLCFGSRQLLQRGCDVHPVTYMYYLRHIHTVQMSDLFEQEQPSLAHGI